MQWMPETAFKKQKTKQPQQQKSFCLSAEATDILGEPDHEGQGQSQIGHSPNLLDSLVALPLQGIRYISSEI